MLERGKQMKKILSTILILTLLFSLVSCGGKDKKADSKNVTTKKEVTVDAKSDAFPKDTEVKVKELKKGAAYNLAKNVIKRIAKKSVIYDITATKDGENVQPDGTVKVTFPILKGFNAKRLAVKYITNDGAMEDVPCKVNKKANTITATLSHFSLYAVIEVMTDADKQAEVVVAPNTIPQGTKVEEAQCLHVFMNATCTKAKFCDKCGIIIGSPLGHDFSKGICKRCNHKDPNYKPQAELNGVKYDVGTQVTVEIILKTEDKNVSVCPTYMIYKSTNGKWAPQDITAKGLLADPYGEEPLGESDKGGPVFTDGEELEYGLWRWMTFDETIDFTEGKTIIKLKYTLAKEGTYKITLQDGLNKEQNQNKYEKALSLKIYK